jgi:hypothetical protein
VKPAVIVDIDGTLALRTGDRSPYDWDRVGEDEPHPPVIELVQLIAAAGRHAVILMSGRDEVCRWQTEMWLDAQGVRFDELWMRAERDNRKDSVVKEELYWQHIHGRYQVSWVIDDRRQVVTMWRRLGLTVLQCADGDF